MNRHPHTANIWDAQNLDPIVAALNMLLTGKDLAVLDVGAGQGRFWSAFRQANENSKYKYYAIEPDANRKPRALPESDKLKWNSTTVEEFLESPPDDQKFNVIVFSLVLHAIPSSWCSIVNEIIATHCADECLILVNEIHGDSIQDKEILLAVDLTQGLDIVPQSNVARNILQNQIRRATKDGVIWNLPIKATDVSCIIPLLESAGFEKAQEIELPPIQISFGKQHYAWTWGARLGEEDLESPLPPEGLDVSAIERWYFYRRVRSTQTASLSLTMSMSRQKAFDYIAYLRPTERRAGVEAGDAMVSRNLPKLIVSTLLNCGLLNQNSCLQAAVLANSASSLITDSVRLDNILLFLRHHQDASSDLRLSKIWRLHFAAFPLLRLPSFSTEFVQSGGKPIIVYNQAAVLPDTFKKKCHYYPVTCPKLEETDFQNARDFDPGAKMNYLRWTGISMTYEELLRLNLSDQERELIKHWFSASTQDQPVEERTHNLSLLLNTAPYLIYLPIRSAWISPDDSTTIGPEHFFLLCLAYNKLDEFALEEIERLHKTMQIESQRMADLTFYSRWKTRHFKASLKSARAALMSRNLSHNVGSHALANPRFFEAMGILNHAGAPSLQTDEDWAALTYLHVKPQRDECSSSATGGTCDVCHQPTPPQGCIVRTADGQAALQTEQDIAGTTEPKTSLQPVLKGEAWRARNRLGTLNSYLQARMDFIARALGETTSQPEAMFFVADILKGFFNQTILLNTLLSDNGYTAADLKFILTLPGQQMPVTFEGQSSDHEMRHTSFLPDSADFRDVMVAVPGGMVGRHAFYAFLENILRNAAKYGKLSRSQAGNRAPSHFEVYITLREGAAVPAIRMGVADAAAGDLLHCYVLQIQDNISQDDNDTVSRVRKYIAQSLIDSEGKPQTEGHGIQEMKVCAGFLAGGDGAGLTFPPDDDAELLRRAIGGSYASFASSSNQKFSGETSLVCHPWVPVSHPSSRFIAYSLLLQKPLLLGIVDYPEGTSRVQLAEQCDAVAFYGSLEALALGPASFAVIKLSDKNHLDCLLKEITKRHTALPYRLMVAVQGNAESTIALQKLVDESSAEIIPARRVKVISYPQLFTTRIDASGEAWQEIILGVYDRWLQAFKQGAKQDSEAKWHLVVAFERAKGYVLDKWNQGERTSVDLGFHKNSSQLQITVKFSPESGQSQQFLNSDSREIKDLTAEKNLLVLDNHGHALADEGKKSFLDHSAASAYHPFSGSQQSDLFQLLDSPPRDRFSRSMLLYAVAEALLTNVVIVDERVADSCLTDGVPQPFGPKMREKQRMRIFPVYSVNAKGVGRFISDTARQALEKETISYGKPEGLILPTETITQPSVRSYVSEDGSNKPIELIGPCDQPDVIVIHEGVTDALHSHEPSLWSKGDHRVLYGICPCVIRTSGRGSQSRYLGDELPFYEFSELSDAAYRQVNKVALVRGLLSLRGQSIP